MELPIVSERTYYGIFAALMVLTGVTIGVAFIDLGFLNNVILLAIAFAKGTLVVLYFMHVRYSPYLTSVTVGLGLFFLAILFVLTMGDYATRNWLPEPVGWTQGRP